MNYKFGHIKYLDVNPDLLFTSCLILGKLLNSICKIEILSPT